MRAMLERDAVAAEEERLRERARALPDASRKAFHESLRHQLKDPDTYAALNWFFLVGLHHFYLGRWARGALDVALFAAGIGLLVLGQPWPGTALILVVGMVELWALFRAQLIVQDWNNGVYRRLLASYEGSLPAAAPARRS